MEDQVTTVLRKEVNQFLGGFDKEFISTVSPRGDAYLFTAKDSVPVIKFEHAPTFRMIINQDAPISVLITLTNRLEEYRDIFGTNVVTETMAYDLETKTVLIGSAARNYLLLREYRKPENTELN